MCIRDSLKRDEARELGRTLLGQALRPYSLNVRRLRKVQTDSLQEELGSASMDEIYEQIGLGERLAPVVAGMLAQQVDVEGEVAAKRRPLDIAGTEGLLVTYAGCCHPIPGDDIVGFMSSGRGVVIHRSGCHNVADYRKHPAKWIPVDLSLIHI